MALIYILIVLFALLIGYQLLLGHSIIEGLENSSTYQPYNLNDPNNALILAQQNAGNIEVLKGQIDQLSEDQKKTIGLQDQINALQTQVSDLVNQQAQYAQDLAGDTPAEITGTE
jgi:predicted PurR-regulated permease PerM